MNKRKRRKQYYKDLKIPWHYRWRFTNWLIARPWKWHYIRTYRSLRSRQSYKEETGRKYFFEPYGRFKSAWYALTFPHIHHENED